MKFILFNLAVIAALFFLFEPDRADLHSVADRAYAAVGMARDAATKKLLKDSFDKAKKVAGLRHFTFHDLRRAVSDRFRSIGTPVDRYCRFMGHSAITGLRHYSVVDPDDLHADLLAGLDAARKRKT